MNPCAVLSWILVSQLGFLGKIFSGFYRKTSRTRPWSLCSEKSREESLLSCFSHVWLFETLGTVTHQAPLSMGFSRQEYWSGLTFPPPRDLPDPGIEPSSLSSPALAGGFFTTSTTWAAPEKIESWLNHSIKEFNHQWLTDSDSSSSVYFNLREFL